MSGRGPWPRPGGLFSRREVGSERASQERAGGALHGRKFRVSRTESGDGAEDFNGARQLLLKVCPGNDSISDGERPALCQRLFTPTKCLVSPLASVLWRSRP